MLERIWGGTSHGGFKFVVKRYIDYILLVTNIADSIRAAAILLRALPMILLHTSRDHGVSLADASLLHARPEGARQTSLILHTRNHPSTRARPLVLDTRDHPHARTRLHYAPPLHRLPFFFFSFFAVSIRRRIHDEPSIWYIGVRYTRCTVATDSPNDPRICPFFPCSPSVRLPDPTAFHTAGSTSSSNTRMTSCSGSMSTAGSAMRIRREQRIQNTRRFARERTAVAAPGSSETRLSSKFKSTFH